MRAISMTPFDALAVTDGLNSSVPFNWSTDSLPPNMWELVAIHSAENYPPDAAALATAERLTPTGLELHQLSGLHGDPGAGWLPSTDQEGRGD